jgi:hypothetical protein
MKKTITNFVAALMIGLFLMIPASAAMAQRTYILGPRGGCYYINSNGNKTYVDRSLCGQPRPAPKPKP